MGIADGRFWSSILVLGGRVRCWEGWWRRAISLSSGAISASSGECQSCYTISTIPEQKPSLWIATHPESRMGTEQPAPPPHPPSGYISATVIGRGHCVRQYPTGPFSIFYFWGFSISPAPILVMATNTQTRTPSENTIDKPETAEL